jgi:hypothetical protein
MTTLPNTVSRLMLRPAAERQRNILEARPMFVGGFSRLARCGKMLVQHFSAPC